MQLFVFSLILGFVRGQSGVTFDDKVKMEQLLRQELLNGYDVQQRPSGKVSVIISLTFQAVNDLNIKDQTLSFSCYFTMTWVDSRLDWLNETTTTENFTSLEYFFASGNSIWTPTIILENANKKRFGINVNVAMTSRVDGLSVVNDYSGQLKVTQDGHVNWIPAGVYRISCQSNSTYYPMDTQTCIIKLGGWQHSTAELELKFSNYPVDISFYTQNGEWSLVDVNALGRTQERRKGLYFSSLLFSVKLKRRRLFHIINTILPLAFMAVLIPVVFKLPVESGEKIGFSITVLLSYAVYLTMITDLIPSTSTTPCFLSVYIVFILFLATVAVCCTTFVINLHVRTDDNIPEWLRHFACRYLMKETYLNTCCSCKTNRISSAYKHRKTQNAEATDNNSKTDLAECRKSFEITWKQLAEMMDSVFFKIFTSLILISTSILLFAVTYGYHVE